MRKWGRGGQGIPNSCVQVQLFLAIATRNLQVATTRMPHATNSCASRRVSSNMFDPPSVATLQLPDFVQRSAFNAQFATATRRQRNVESSRVIRRQSF